jgi:hypothetical protein
MTVSSSSPSSRTSISSVSCFISFVSFSIGLSPFVNDGYGVEAPGRGKKTTAPDGRPKTGVKQIWCSLWLPRPKARGWCLKKTAQAAFYPAGGVRIVLERVLGT